MNRAKKARLAAGGWRVGSAAEFLELSKEEAAFVEMKLALARCLRELRIKRKLSQARVRVSRALPRWRRGILP